MDWSSATFLVLDFETWSPVDLRKRGVHNYMRHPKTKALCASYQKVRVSPLGTKPAVRDGNGDLFLHDPNVDKQNWATLFSLVNSSVLVAHNLEFEWLMLRRRAGELGYTFKPLGLVDTAALAQALGLGRSLRQAGAMVGASKLDEDGSLISTFSTGPEMTPGELINHPRYIDLLEYCAQDVEVTTQLLSRFDIDLMQRESPRLEAALLMNDAGWPVDMDSVRSMRAMADINKEEAFQAFCRAYPGTPETFFGSSKQLRQFTRDRGITMDSFDEQHVTAMVRKLEARRRTEDEEQVLDMLHTKQLLGGSGLSKLDVIERMIGDDDRLRGQYMHVGAGQTYRTTGVGVQMQNLKRLPPQPFDLPYFLRVWEKDGRLGYSWSNEDLGKNLRQVFNVKEPGRLIVGDFSSVESRALAWVAGAEWKLEEFRQGKDMYKVMAERIFHTPYGDVVKAQRQIGKVGELSCGYNAGGPAVQDYAAKMGIELSAVEAADLVRNWRRVNVEIVALWAELDNALRRAVSRPGTSQDVELPRGHITVTSSTTLASIDKQHPGAEDLTVFIDMDGLQPFSRVLRGVYRLGTSLVYHKPSPTKTGPLWRDYYTSTKTKRRVKNTIYGGKLTGIVIQSLCRELFMDIMVAVSEWTQSFSHTDVKLVGQFHDELVLEYTPTNFGVGVGEMADGLKALMSTCNLPGFPLEAEVAMDRRYIK